MNNQVVVQMRTAQLLRLTATRFLFNLNTPLCSAQYGRHSIRQSNRNRSVHACRAHLAGRIQPQL